MAASRSCILTVDRTEDGVIILIDETETVYRATADMLGIPVREGDILCVVLAADGRILSAENDTEATANRRAAMREKLRRLFCKEE